MKKTAKFIMLILCVFVTAMLIICSENVKRGVIGATLLCGKSVIPSLFPIFCVTLFIANSGSISLATQRLAPLFVFSLSQFSGYPVGAKLLDSMVQCGQLKESAAQKMLPSMICAGPAFVINIAGVQMFSNVFIGIRLYICQIIANLILFIINGGLTVRINRYVKCNRATKIFTDSIKQSADSVINICAYVVLFSAFSEVFNTLFGKDISKYFLYIFEVTGAVYNSNNIFITCAVLSWSGVCVIFQVLSVTEKIHIKILSLILSRMSGAVISCIILKISFYIFPYASPVISNLQGFPEPAIADNISFFMVIIFSLFVFLLSLSKRSTGKFFKDIIGEFN